MHHRSFHFRASQFIHSEFFFVIISIKKKIMSPLLDSSFFKTFSFYFSGFLFDFILILWAVLCLVRWRSVSLEISHHLHGPWSSNTRLRHPSCALSRKSYDTNRSAVCFHALNIYTNSQYYLILVRLVVDCHSSPI